MRYTWLVLLLGPIAVAVAACGSNDSSGLQDQPGVDDAGADSGEILFDAGDGGAGNDCPDGDCTSEPGSICGNGTVEEGESCDDGNARPADGCSGLCRLEPNYVCPEPGEPCVSTVVCGDGQIGGGEACDDGNTEAQDGCSALCEVEPGYACSVPGAACTPVVQAECGDGSVNAGEQCDDGGKVDGDGCSAACQLEPGWTCPTPGETCKQDEYCGNGNLADDEECDDGNGSPGDGCTGLCIIEPFYECSVSDQGLSTCSSTIVCGDLKVVGDEACDDGNRESDDGCSSDCKQIEPGFTCPTASGVGGICTAVPDDVCGDSRLSYGEFCDDGNDVSGDGCTNCTVDPGYTCPAVGQACTLLEWCGDGKLSLARGEECDDGNEAGGDGCSATCIQESNFVCPQPGQLCQSTVKCGDQNVTGDETCDDGNLDADDGCSADCQVEPGWVCPSGRSCRAAECGDGFVVGLEECDDGDVDSNDGCDANCELEDGYKCEGSDPQVCSLTECGDGIVEGTEACEDENNDLGDGCTPLCTLEPDCDDGACTSACGDGIKFDSEECDDGNRRSGDGCSANCKEEPGYTCVVPSGEPSELSLPVVYRDFDAGEPYHDDTPEAAGHPGVAPHSDFEWPYGDWAFNPPARFNGTYRDAGGDTTYSVNTVGVLPGTVRIQLGQSSDGADLKGKPIFAFRDPDTNGDGLADNCPLSAGQVRRAGVNYCAWTIQSETTFHQWYRDVPGANVTAVRELILGRTGSNQYVFDSGGDGFFPIDDLTTTKTFGGESHNLHFTSEVRYWFKYDPSAGASFDFRGDDDVFVFVNGRLVVDIGGIHSAANRAFILNDSLEDLGGTPLNLVQGQVYEIVVFQAERNCCGSNYKLTLQNFLLKGSECTSVCGDGIVTRDEACDLGTANNTGDYGTCNSDCTLPDYCGDGAVQSSEGEQCDDGFNLSTYGGTSRECGPECRWASYCGDGIVDGSDGEACDEGANNGMGYGHCTTSCQLGPRCGDGVTSHDEQCDDGNANGTSSSECQSDCILKCGNGTLDAGEECDDGAAGNTGGYGKCRSNCTLAPYCGDGIKNGGEACDDGKNDGTYGTCAPGCELGPRCGDGQLQSTAGEICDAGAQNNPNAYGEGLCTTRCWPAPFCGDRSVDLAQGEQCDDGVNDGSPGSCKTDCSEFVPLPSCGDGSVQEPEECDDGSNNGTASSSCDIHCRVKCGNGFKDPGEQCDDGTNDGSYGTCNPDCTLTGYCGDGKKNGSEQCDLGAGNKVDAYGRDTCTSSCLIGPYCGDGRLQSSFGESCDSNAGCNSSCEWIIPR